MIGLIEQRIRRLFDRKDRPAMKDFHAALRRLKKGEYAIDCGAKVGRFTREMAQTRANVIAFEPNPHAFAVLSKKFANRRNVTCFNKAVGAENETRKLYLDERSGQDPVRYATASTLLPYTKSIVYSDAVEVEVVDLVEFVGSLGGHVGVVKMDVEGAEIEILEKILKADPRAFHVGKLFIEMHDHKMPELEARGAYVRQQIEERRLDWIDLRWH